MKSIKIYHILCIFNCLFIIDSVFHFGRILGNDTDFVRLFLFVGILFFCSILFLDKNIKIKKKYILSIILFLSVVFISYVKAIFLRQNIEIANEFIQGYLYFAFLPSLYLSIRNRKQLYILLKLLIILGTTLSLLSLILLISNLKNLSLYPKIITFIEYFDLMNLMFREGNTLRIMFSCVLLQLISFFLAIYFYLDKGKIIFVVLLLINLGGLFVTYSRGIIAGVFFGSLFILLNYYRFPIKSRFRIRLLLFFVLILIFICFNILLKQNNDIVTYFMDRLFNNHETDSNNTRLLMKNMLYELISKHIFWGNGAGAHIFLRDGRVELVYHDIVSKLGMVGLLCFLYPFFSMLLLQKKDKKMDYLSSLRLCALASLLAIIIASYSNTYLVTSLGLLMYCLCMCLFLWKNNKGVLVRK